MNSAITRKPPAGNWAFRMEAFVDKFCKDNEAEYPHIWWCFGEGYTAHIYVCPWWRSGETEVVPEPFGGIYKPATEFRYRAIHNAIWTVIADGNKFFIEQINEIPAEFRVTSEQPTK